MSTSQRLDSETFLQWMTPATDTLAASLQRSSPAVSTAETLPASSAALRINTLLQTTLDLEQVCAFFSNEVKTLLPHDSLAYRNPGQKIELIFGAAARHTCSYRLMLREESLGEVTVTRKKKFTAGEITLLEHLLCGLIYPLRNALTYRAALQASLKDPLTGVANRAALDASLSREVEMARRHGLPLSLIVMDLDHFKKINDRYGHSMGDTVIKAFISMVGAVIRKSDMLFRYGGEEFVVLLGNTACDGALLLAERIRRRVENIECGAGNEKIPVSASLGVASLEAGDESQSLFEKADSALYQAKQEGRNRVRFMHKQAS